MVFLGDLDHDKCFNNMTYNVLSAQTWEGQKTEVIHIDNQLCLYD
jgi:hypothetical protein